MELHYFQFLSVTVLVVIIAVFIAKERYHQLHDRIFIALQCRRAVCLFSVLSTIVGEYDSQVYMVYLTIASPFSLCLIPLAFLYVRTVAKELGVNRHVLSTYINKEKGMFRYAPEHLLERKNFNQWINTLRIEEAKHMISTSPDTKITQVASLCGFSTPQLFSRVFRQIAGQTPQSYRETQNK